WSARLPRAARPARPLWSARRLVPGLVGLSLLPLLPTPLPAGDREPVPEFIRHGHWRACVSPGGVLVPVPPPTPQEPEAMRWASAAKAAFALPEGFFIGAYGRDGGPSMGTFKQPTSALLATVAETGVVPRIGARERAQARADLSFGRAQCLVLADRQPHREALAETLTRLLGDPGERLADARFWRADRVTAPAG